MAWEPDYVTTADYKTWARITDDDDNTAIGRAITSASRAVDRYCSQHVPRQFGLVASAEARYYTPRWDCDLIRWVIEIDDLELANLAGFTIEVDTSNSDTYDEEITDYVLRPRDAPQNNRPYTQVAIATASSVQPTFFRDSAKVTARYGWTTVPTTVVEATLLQTNRIHKRRTAVFNATGSPEKKTQKTINLINQLDVDIEVMLESYVKLGWTV